MSDNSKLTNSNQGLGLLLNAANASSVLDEYEQKIVEYFLNKYGPNLIQVNINYLDENTTALDWNRADIQITVVTEGISIGDPMKEDTDAIDNLMPGERELNCGSFVWTVDESSDEHDKIFTSIGLKALYRR